MNATWRHFRIDIDLADRITVWVDVENRSLNVLFEDVFDELFAIIESFRKQGPEVPIVFRSSKQRGFVVGADLRRILAIESDAEIQAFLLKGQEVLESIEQLEQATVALIQGPCLGGGLEFAMACRFRLAMDDSQTQIGLPEAKIGLMPGWGGTQRLIELVGLAHGLPMLMSGAPIDAKRALAIHLVDALIDPANSAVSLTEQLSRLDEIAQENAAAVDLSKDSDSEGRVANANLETPSQVAIHKAVTLGIEESRQAGFRAERELFWRLLSDPAVREKLQSFGGKK